MRQGVTSLIEHLEPVEHGAPHAPTFNRAHARERGAGHRLRRDLAGEGARIAATDTWFVHRFDTERRDLERSGHRLELRECNGSFFVLASMPEEERLAGTPAPSQVQIDNAWAVQILTEERSPLAALEQRLGHQSPHTVQELRQITGARKLRRVGTSVERPSRSDEPTGPSRCAGSFG